MENENYRYRRGRSTNSHLRTQYLRGGTHYRTDEIDRYNYVDRNIYSSNRGRPPRRKKGGRVKKVLLSLLLLILVAGLFAVGYAMDLFSKLDRSEKINTSQYIEQPSAAPAWSVISDKNITNILLLGTDQLDKGTSRSDTTMLVSIDNKTKAVRLVSFLRDLYVEIPTIRKQKLNAAYAKGGPALTMQTLENNFRINIDKYISVDFNSFAQIVNKLGGLDINLDKKLCKEMNENMGSSLKPGVNHLNGRLTLYYARIRNTDSDFGRTGRQREVIELILQKLKGKNPLEVNAVMRDFFPLVKTNLSDTELMYLVSIAGPVSKYPMKTMHVPALNTFTEPTVPGVGQVLDADIEENARLLREFLYGADESAPAVP